MTAEELRFEAQRLRQELAKWRGRSIEVCEVACQLCRSADPDLCRHCRIEKIRREATE